MRAFAPVFLAASILASQATVSLAGPFYYSTVLSSNPTSFYKLSESSGTTAVDSSPSAVNGTYTNTGVTYGVPGPVFNGSTAVTWNGSSGDMSANVSVAQSFTVEAWAKSAGSTWNNYGWIASARGSDGFIIHPNQGASSVDAYVFDNTGAFHGAYSFNVGTTNITNWNQYVLSYDAVAGTVRTYLDGVLQNTVAATIARDATGTVALNVGDDNAGGAGRWGSGSSADISIYSTVLSDATILAHYNAAISTVPEPSSVVLGAVGAIGLLVTVRRRRKV